MTTDQFTLKLFATLRAYMPETGENHPLSPGLMVKSLLEELNIPEKDAKLVFINGRKAGLNAVINAGDRVGIFPPVGGG